jgi:Ran GTPase-activating protein 1
MATSKIFSLEGKGLKLDTAAEVEAHIKPLREMNDVEEVRLLGNTLGVEACKVIGEVLETKKTLQVCFYARIQVPLTDHHSVDSKSGGYIYWPFT